MVIEQICSIYTHYTYTRIYFRKIERKITATTINRKRNSTCIVADRLVVSQQHICSLFFSFVTFRIRRKSRRRKKTAKYTLHTKKTNVRKRDTCFRLAFFLIVSRYQYICPSFPITILMKKKSKIKPITQFNFSYEIKEVNLKISVH